MFCVICNGSSIKQPTQTWVQELRPDFAHCWLEICFKISWLFFITIYRIQGSKKNLLPLLSDNLGWSISKFFVKWALSNVIFCSLYESEISAIMLKFFYKKLSILISEGINNFRNLYYIFKESLIFSPSIGIKIAWKFLF